ncbi:hypothetical protein PSACC_01638 [Paramicrosporidium saccamoebae]|uniref:Uncharacterized protein n=1 Tax=Paramicrosporidium saccamoebae TaxID=1246581 RepID=A0A2H9TLM5_9FUNG|nr:hypothetical protein PSACC_01638 [Paramicrosporidium saccamoebae]
MLIKNIIGLCLLAVVAAGNDENKDAATKAKTAETSVLSPDASAKQLRKADCEKLTVKELNALKDAKACAGLTAECLKKFDVTDLCADCLSNINTSEWAKFDGKTAEQIAKSKVSDISLTPQQLTEILAKLNLDDLPAGFTGYAIREPILLEAIFETSDAKVISAFLTADNVAALNPVALRRFGETLISSLNDDAFSKISALQLSMIPSDSFAGFTAKQWCAVAPAALTMLHRDQASKLSKDCWNAMTPLQVASFGLPASSAAKLAAKDPSLRNQEILNRRQFKRNHACMALSVVKSDLDDKQAKALEAKCADITGFSENGSNTLGASLGLFAVSLTIALVPVLL